MNPKALAWTDSLFRRQVNASCVMRSASKKKSSSQQQTRARYGSRRTLGESSKARLIKYLEGGLLLDPTMSRRDANRLESKLAEVKLLAEVLGSDPVNVDRAFKVELGGEDAAAGTNESAFSLKAARGIPLTPSSLVPRG